MTEHEDHTPDQPTPRRMPLALIGGAVLGTLVLGTVLAALVGQSRATAAATQQLVAARQTVQAAQTATAQQAATATATPRATATPDAAETATAFTALQTITADETALAGAPADTPVPTATAQPTATATPAQSPAAVLRAAGLPDLTACLGDAQALLNDQAQIAAAIQAGTTVFYSSLGADAQQADADCNAVTAGFAQMDWDRIGRANARAKDALGHLDNATIALITAANYDAAIAQDMEPATDASAEDALAHAAALKTVDDQATQELHAANADLGTHLSP